MSVVKRKARFVPVKVGRGRYITRLGATQKDAPAGKPRGYRNRLHEWFAAASVPERETLAAMVGTSVGTLEQYGLGSRNPSAERGLEIEQATKLLAAQTRGRLPVVLRSDIVTACQQCDFAKRCLGTDRVVAGAFPVVVEGDADDTVELGDSEGGDHD